MQNIDTYYLTHQLLLTYHSLSHKNILIYHDNNFLIQFNKNVTFYIYFPILYIHMNRCILHSSPCLRYASFTFPRTNFKYIFFSFNSSANMKQSTTHF